MNKKSNLVRQPLTSALAAAVALLTGSPRVSGSDSIPTTTIAPAAVRRSEEKEKVVPLVLAPSEPQGVLLADHASHSSHSSHVSSSAPYVPSYTPPPYAPPTPVSPPSAPDATSPPSPNVETPPPASAPVTQLAPELLNKLSKLLALWPKKIKLVQPFIFTFIHDGVATGTMNAVAGTRVDLIKVKGERLVIALLDAKAEVSAAITDIGDEVDMNALISATIPDDSPGTITNTPPVAPSPGR